MPIVVDEVVISVEVTNQESGGGAPAAGGAAGGADDRQAIVEECVERVIEILRRREER
ncbi:MAG TPA: DUF5908 family protein [Thermoanaerobaculia bacterium]|nr:DUF5908 family protein [Thermoanaerobaculia bacterium]